MWDKSQIPVNDNFSDCRPQYPEILNSQLSEYYYTTVLTIIRELKSLHKYLGAKYLLELIAKPDSSIHCTNMKNLFNQSKSAFYDENIEPTDENNDFDCEVSYFNYSKNPLNELPIEAADDRAIKQVMRHLYNTIEAMHIRQSYNDLSAVEDLLDEIEKCQEWLFKTVNKNGKSRVIVNQGNKDYQSVTKAIKSVVDMLRAKDPELGRFCDLHLVLGTRLSWRTDPIK